MPWKESDRMSERMKFLSRYLDGERMTDLCREFNISRKSGYKLVERYDKAGASAFRDQSRAPRSHPNQTSGAMESAIISLRQQHPTWGAPKIKSYLERKSKGVPAKSTVHAILQRHELVKVRRRSPSNAKARGTHLSRADKANALWCTDFKGQFRLGNQSYCYPLTVTDQHSRYLLACEAFECISEDLCIQAFHQLFTEFGLPESIRSDNGVPFASTSYLGISKLSLFWVRLGISLERIIPGHPEENGCHERMHRTLKADATKPASFNILSQQERLDAFKEIYNKERPHEALGMDSPANHYAASKRTYNPDLELLTYPEHDLTARITKCGKIFIANKKISVQVTVGKPFGGQNVGLKHVEGDIWQVDFMHYNLGFFDLETQKLRIAVNPFLKERYVLE